MPRPRFGPVRFAAIGAAAVAVAVTVTACGSSSGDGSGASAGGGAGSSTVVTVGALSNGAAKEVDITVPAVASIRAKLPAAVRDGGQLRIGIGALPAGIPPLTYIGSDQKTLTGSEPDLGRLVAAVLGLEPEFANSTWENMFVGIDSGRNDIGFSNITVTEERKQNYDFASYRQDDLAFEVAKSTGWNFNGDYRNLAGKTVAVGSGTNQERILLEWQRQLRAQGKDLTVKYFQDQNSVYLALGSGRIDTYFNPNPSIQYHVAQVANTPNPTRNAGNWSGAGATLQGLIAATSKKGSGLAQPVADAINYLIKSGDYAKWLTAWNLTNEAVPAAQVNPPGLPLTDS